MTPFTLGRMRKLDLLALYHRENPDGHDRWPEFLASMSGEQLATAILQARAPRP